MKLDILLVDFALVALVFGPYIIFTLLGRRGAQALRKKFVEEASKHHLKISEKDSWNNNIIGLDSNKLVLLLVQQRKTGIAVELVDLKEVRSCGILQDVQTLKIEKQVQNILQRVDLQLKLHNHSDRIVNFFSCEETYSQEYELEHAEKWSSKIRAAISFRPTVHSAA